MKIKVDKIEGIRPDFGASDKKQNHYDGALSTPILVCMTHLSTVLSGSDDPMVDPIFSPSSLDKFGSGEKSRCHGTKNKNNYPLQS
ncbi:hypothetical protein B9S53_11715 [Arthrospira sp. O9.13F]|nr:hypothetical protein B9S53_11715 [Arthrospira sp. O9.13F]